MGGCATRKVTSEFEFANKLAQKGLWKEALYRWEKASKEKKHETEIYNNMAVAYEQMGKFDQAEKMYQKALRVSPDNATVQVNLNRMKKMYKKTEEEKEKKDKHEKE